MKNEQEHWEAVRRHHEEMAKLPYEKKIEIMEQLLADYEVIKKSIPTMVTPLVEE